MKESPGVNAKRPISPKTGMNLVMANFLGEVMGEEIATRLASLEVPEVKSEKPDEIDGGEARNFVDVIAGSVRGAESVFAEIQDGVSRKEETRVVLSGGGERPFGCGCSGKLTSCIFIGSTLPISANFGSTSSGNPDIARNE